MVPIAPIPDAGLFGSVAWREAGEVGEFEVVVYNSLTVDPDSVSLHLNSIRSDCGDGDI